MTPVYDLHAHSTASDGTLTPGALVERAVARGVGVLALTDHDTVDGLTDAAAAAAGRLTLVPGVEVSATWEGASVHVVGLRIDATEPRLVAGLAGQLSYRDRRAEAISESLASAGIQGALDGARAHCHGRLLSRTHFARDLVERGYVDSMSAAFRKYLTRGKPGHVVSEWVDLATAVNWIVAAGGDAVLAHPGRYRLTRKQLRRLLRDFAAAGGTGLEVVCGCHSRDEVHVMAAHARDFGLAASAGSDFHGPGQSARELGVLPALPKQCRPIWRDWPATS